MFECFWRQEWHDRVVFFWHDQEMSFDCWPDVEDDVDFFIGIDLFAFDFAADDLAEYAVLLLFFELRFDFGA